MDFFWVLGAVSAKRYEKLQDEHIALQLQHIALLQERNAIAKVLESSPGVAAETGT